MNVSCLKFMFLRLEPPRDSQTEFLMVLTRFKLFRAADYLRQHSRISAGKMFTFAILAFYILNSSRAILRLSVSIQSLYFECKCCGPFGPIACLQCLPEH